MKGGNEALLNSHKLNLPVRLARFIGKEVEESYTGRMYIYDGLYVSHGVGACIAARIRNECPCKYTQLTQTSLGHLLQS